MHRRGITTTAFAVGAMVAILGAVAITRIGAARRMERARVRTQRATEQVVGSIPDVRFVFSTGPDTLAPGGAGTEVLLLVTALGCRPCEHFVTLVAELAASPGFRRAEVWVEGPLDLAQMRALSRVTTVREVRPTDPAMFRHQYAVDAVPYLAYLDEAGTIRRVHIGYWPGVRLDWGNGL